MFFVIHLFLMFLFSVSLYSMEEKEWTHILQKIETQNLTIEADPELTQLFKNIDHALHKKARKTKKKLEIIEKFIQGIALLNYQNVFSLKSQLSEKSKDVIAEASYSYWKFINEAKEEKETLKQKIEIMLQEMQKTISVLNLPKPIMIPFIEMFIIHSTVFLDIPSSYLTTKKGCEILQKRETFDIIAALFASQILTLEKFPEDYKIEEIQTLSKTTIVPEVTKNKNCAAGELQKNILSFQQFLENRRNELLKNAN